MTIGIVVGQLGTSRVLDNNKLMQQAVQMSVYAYKMGCYDAKHTECIEETLAYKKKLEKIVLWNR